MFKISKSKQIDFAKISEKAENLFDAIPLVKRRRRRRRVVKIFKYLVLVLLALIILFILFFGKNFINIKNIYSASLSGKDNLEYAIQSIKRQDFDQATIYSSQARDNFDFALNQVNELKGNFFISRISFLKNQINDFEYLIKTAEILSKAVRQAGAIGWELNKVIQGRLNVSFSKFSTAEKREILKLVYESGPELNGLKANLDLAALNLDKVRLVGLLWLLEDRIEKLKTQVNLGRELIYKTIPLSEIIPKLAGYPEQNQYLVMLENSDELRPTGGFLGTYGILKTDSGDIKSFDTHDIYHLDMPVKDTLNVVPPAPLKEYLGVDKWFLRDANWSPDWPTAAQKIEWFYNKEYDLMSPALSVQPGSQPEFDGLIAVTPRLITDLLSITGPIVVEGEKYDKDNFVRLLQYKVERGYIQLGVPSWHRKEIIGDIFKELKIRLFDLPASRWPEIFNVIEDNLLKKNIIVFFKDEQLQNLAKEMNWAGDLREVSGDYLMVVDANMAALKTDAVMSKSIDYKLEQRVNGLFVKLSINYAHHGNFDWQTTRYRTYTRVYVPQGSKLIKARGLTEGEVEIKNELGKTYFGAFISIEPGEIGTLYFEYKLPAKLAKSAEDGTYELYVQKQPGNNINELIVDLKLLNKVKSYNPVGFYAERIGDQRIRWETDLNTDKEFRINF